MTESPCQVSVQEMRGRFELLRQHSTYNPSSTERIHDESNELVYRKPPRLLNTNVKNHSVLSGGSPAIRDDIAHELCHEEESSPRLRSFSTGGNKNPELNISEVSDSIKPLNHPFSINETQNSKACFASFAEKQKLVEGIVLNIKNSSKNDDSSDQHQRQTTTSKLEKDLKNALERGVRRWSIIKNKAPREKLSDESHCNTTSHGQVRLNGENGIRVNYLHKTEDKQVERSGLLEHPHQKYGAVDTKKPNFASTVARTQFNQHNNLAFGNSKENQLLTDTSHEFVKEPLRPPRKRTPKKKPKAPMPPNTTTNLHSYFHDLAHNKLKNSSDPFTSKEKIDDSSATKMLASPIQTKEIVYYSTPSNEDPTYLSKYAACNERIYDQVDQSENNVEVRKGDVSASSNKDPQVLPTGPPPRKPPRTFAHDIYRSMKPLNDEHTGVHSQKAHKTLLTQLDIEALYSKPIKRLKDKRPLKQDADFDGVPKIGGFAKEVKKPLLAPKPPNIGDISKKRFSIASPEYSNDEIHTRESRSIKRNSSLRSSLRKLKKFSSPRGDGRVGSRWKQIAKNLNFQKKGHPVEEEPISHRSRSEEILSSTADRSPLDEDDPIYATPLAPSARRKGASQELHYMCSPLFDAEAESESSKRGCDEEAPEVAFKTNRMGLVEGFKKDFRQSCRLLVQQRLRR